VAFSPALCSPSRHTGTSEEDPTLPQEALVSRESARLFARVCPPVSEGVLATRVRYRYGRFLSSDGVDGNAPTPRRASTIAKVSPRACGPRWPPLRGVRCLRAKGLGLGGMLLGGTWALAVSFSGGARIGK